jgi:hypothetical protein
MASSPCDFRVPAARARARRLDGSGAIPPSHKKSGFTLGRSRDFCPAGNPDRGPSAALDFVAVLQHRSSTRLAYRPRSVFCEGGTPIHWLLRVLGRGVDIHWVEPGVGRWACVAGRIVRMVHALVAVAGSFRSEANALCCIDRVGRVEWAHSGGGGWEDSLELRAAGPRCVGKRGAVAPRG